MHLKWTTSSSTLQPFTYLKIAVEIIVIVESHRAGWNLSYHLVQWKKLLYSIPAGWSYGSSAFPGSHFFFEWLHTFKSSLNAQKHFIILIWNMLPCNVYLLIQVLWHLSIMRPFQFQQWNIITSAAGRQGRIHQSYHKQTLQSLSYAKHFTFKAFSVSIISFYFSASQWEKTVGNSTERCLVPWRLLLRLVTRMGGK